MYGPALIESSRASILPAISEGLGLFWRKLTCWWRLWIRETIFGLGSGTCVPQKIRNTEVSWFRAKHDTIRARIRNLRDKNVP